MRYDERRIAALLEESQDLHSDGMCTLGDGLDELVETGQERRIRGEIEAGRSDRRAFLRRSVFAAGTLGAGFGAAQLGRATLTVAADSATDIQMLQTAASIENLAVAVYKKAASLPPTVSGASNPVIASFVMMTIQQHTDHGNAFNAAVTKLGGKPQTEVDKPVYDAVVTPALAGLTGPDKVVALATTLENAAAQTYVKFGGSVDSADALQPFASIAPVEAQHVAVLLAVGAIVGVAGLGAVTLPPDLAKLPGAAGSVGFPDTFYKFDMARPADEGAVK